MKSDVRAAKVPFYNYGALAAERGPEVMAAIADVLARGAFVLQEDVARFEEALAAHLGIGQIVGVGNCTDGLELIFRAIGIGPGDEVIVPAHTFVATAGAVRSVGAVPRFAEVGPAHDIELAELDRLSTEATRAVVPVSLNGRCADLDGIVEMAASRGWHVIEDAAQALGARLRGRAAGTFGVAGAFSFYPAKTLGAVGDAGAVVSCDDSLIERVRLIRDHGRDNSGEVRTWGRNSRLDNLQAAVLSVQLRYYPTDVERRRSIFSTYQREMASVRSLTLPLLDERDRFDICQNFEIEADDREQLRSGLAELGIGTALPWGGRSVTEFEGLDILDETPRTAALSRRLLLLPLHQYMTEADVELVVGAVLKVRG